MIEEKATALASGSATSRRFRLFVFSFSLFALAWACRGGAERRHLYQDKHTPNALLKKTKAEKQTKK